MKQPSIRQLRVANEIKEALAHIMLYDNSHSSALYKALSIASVEITADLRTVYVEITCREPTLANSIIKDLNKRSKSLLYTLLQKIKLRHAPTLKFRTSEKNEEEEKKRQRLEMLIEEANIKSTKKDDQF